MDDLFSLLLKLNAREEWFNFFFTLHKKTTISGLSTKKQSFYYPLSSMLGWAHGFLAPSHKFLTINVTDSYFNIFISYR